MQIVFSPKAAKEFARLPKELQRRLAKKLQTYTDSPRPLAFAKAMAGDHTGSYRYRIGDYRVIFDYTVTQISIYRIGHRKDVYQ